MPSYIWDNAAQVYRDLQTGQEYTPDFWGDPTFQWDFTAGATLDDWNIRDNFVTIDTARGVTENVVLESDGLHLLGTWLDNAPVTGGPQGFYTHDTGYIDQRHINSDPNPQEHYSQQYGRWEVRCKTPTGTNTRGALAAFWLRCDSTPGEIDIMEAWGGGGTMNATWTNWVKDTAYTTFHSSTMSESVNGKPYTKTLWRHFQHGAPRDVGTNPHTYTFEYMPDYCAMYVDGTQIFRVTPTSTDPENGGTLAWLWDPDFFGSPFHMRVNLHVGPSENFWGLPDPNNREWTVDPLDYHIEHIKVWRYDP